MDSLWTHLPPTYHFLRIKPAVLKTVVVVRFLSSALLFSSLFPVCVWAWKSAFRLSHQTPNNSDLNLRHAKIFVAVWGTSKYTYTEATWTQTLPDWIGSHVRAFASFGGVPQIVVPDNLRSSVTKACRYEPELNPPTPIWSATMAWPSSRPGFVNPATRPRSKQTSCWWNAGSWPACDVRPSSVWRSSTLRWLPVMACQEVAPGFRSWL